MSRCGFFASCAAVDTASKPMKAKKITPAPRSTPLQPNCAEASPVFVRDERVPVRRVHVMKPTPMTRKMTATFMITMTLLTRADSLMPMTRSQRHERDRMHHRRHVQHRAGAREVVRRVHRERRVASTAAGMTMPNSARNGTKLPDSTPTATVAAPNSVLEHQVPADDPRDELAHRRVAVRVRRAGDRDHARELGVAEAGEAAGEAGERACDSTTAGPAYSAAALPVSTKMPAPMMAPMPSSDEVGRRQRATRGPARLRPRPRAGGPQYSFSTTNPSGDLRRRWFSSNVHDDCIRIRRDNFGAGGDVVKENGGRIVDIGRARSLGTATARERASPRSPIVANLAISRPQML